RRPSAHDVDSNHAADSRSKQMSGLHATSFAQPSPPRGRFVADTSTGRIYFWQGGSLWIGEGVGRTEWHGHHAHQLTVAKEGGFRFRTEAEGIWSAFDGALVPSHCTHQFEADGAAMAHLFVEPESRAGRALTARFGSTAVVELPRAAARTAAGTLFGARQS